MKYPKNIFTISILILITFVLGILGFSYFPYQLFSNNNVNGVNKFENDEKYFAQEIVYSYQYKNDVTGVYIKSIQKDCAVNNNSKCFGEYSWQVEKKELSPDYTANIIEIGHYGIPKRELKISCNLN